MHGGLNGGTAYAGEGCYFVDWKVADTVPLNFASNDAQDSALALSVVMPETVRQRAGTAQHPATVSRSFTIGGSLTLTWQKAAYAAVHFVDFGKLAHRWSAAQWAPPLDAGDKV